MRPPAARPAPNRAQTATPTLAGRASPAEHMLSSKNRTPKRKQPPAAPVVASEFEQELGLLEETSIHVVVRCRGRSDREVRENSGVVVQADNIVGKRVELSMGPNALSNKMYQFDKVFSPAADQGMVFDEVVAPILDEVLNGFNCTVFAYGQTGTGKTYTMSGDISDAQPIPEAAGIIPRVLHRLFEKLGDEDGEKREHSVKCSFIELYNEELRDLFSADDSTKLKIFDDANKNGRTTMLVQGMEESHIESASRGIQLFRDGSYKRQVAATKCNDLSSRSHTVFAITVYMKRFSDAGEEVLSGKLNLVDLAGSENIQRSGAENKRAAEAGLINKSLLTLGRVITALVDRSSHIPYRESKLTRLLQDSLGGKTKTCIIATLSPAKSNLEETISTLDYAFRAKNIRNKPQMNQMVSKKTLLREFTAEIEKLKSELIAARLRNGVYLTAETYEVLTTESESRRILSEEQHDKIATLETHLRNKSQEIFVLTNNFQSLKKDSEQTRNLLDGTKDVLAKAEIALAYTKRSLADETYLREAHETTEEKLAEVGRDLISTLGTTTDHVGRLHSKLKRRSDLQSINRTKWIDSQSQVATRTALVEDRIEMLRGQQEGLIDALSKRMQSFVTDELQELQSSQEFLDQKAAAFESSQAEVHGQTTKARDDMNVVLHEIGVLRDDVKQKVSAGLDDLSTAAQRISAGIASELDAFRQELQDSYASLGREFKTMFDDMIKTMNEQQTEAQRLRHQIGDAHASLIQSQHSSQAELKETLDKERETAAQERQTLLSKISNLVNESAAAQDARMNVHFEMASKRIKTSEEEFCVTQQTYGSGMDSWAMEAQRMIDSALRARDSIKGKLQTDWTSANEHTFQITDTTRAVHGEAIRIVDDQKAQLDSQLAALNEIVSRVQAQNEGHHKVHNSSLGELARHVQESYRNIGAHVKTSYSRTETLDTEMRQKTAALMESLPELQPEGDIRRGLRSLREDLSAAQIAEYTTTGETPAKMQYTYPTVLPRTEDHEVLLDRLRGPPQPPRSLERSPNKRSPSKAKSSPIKAPSSPTKTLVFADATMPTLALSQTASAPASSRPHTSASSQPSLRELDVNVAPAGAIAAVAAGNQSAEAPGAEGSKLSASTAKKHGANPLATSQTETKTSAKRGATRTMPTEREKENFSLSSSVGSGTGRRLRNRGSD